MGYIQDLERELREKLDGMSDEELIKYFKEKVMESYRNGIGSVRPAKGRGRSTQARPSSHGQA